MMNISACHGANRKGMYCAIYIVHLEMLNLIEFTAEYIFPNTTPKFITWKYYKLTRALIPFKPWYILPATTKQQYKHNITIYSMQIVNSTGVVKFLYDHLGRVYRYTMLYYRFILA